MNLLEFEANRKRKNLDNRISSDCFKNINFDLQIDKVNYRKKFREVKSDIKKQIESNFNIFDGLSTKVNRLNKNRLDPEMYELIKSAFCSKFLRKNEVNALNSKIIIDQNKSKLK